MRQKGRRKKASEEVFLKWESYINGDKNQVEHCQFNLNQARKNLARDISEAMADGVETQQIAKWLGCTRQNVYQMVKKRVDNG